MSKKSKGILQRHSEFGLDPKCHGYNDVNEASFLQVINRLERLRKVAGGCIAQSTGIFVNNCLASSIIAKCTLEKLQQQTHLRQTDQHAFLSRLLIPKHDYPHDGLWLEHSVRQEHEGGFGVWTAGVFTSWIRLQPLLTANAFQGQQSDSGLGR